MPKQQLKYQITIENSAGTEENLHIIAGAIVEHCKQEWIAEGLNPDDVSFMFNMPNKHNR